MSMSMQFNRRWHLAELEESDDNLSATVPVKSMSLAQDGIAASASPNAAAPLPVSASAASEEPEWLTQLMHVMQDDAQTTAAADNQADVGPCHGADSPLLAGKRTLGLLTDGNDANADVDNDEFADIADGAQRQGSFHRAQYAPEPAPPHLLSNVSGPLVALPEAEVETEASQTDVPADAEGDGVSSRSAEDVEAVESPYADARPSGCGSDTAAAAEQHAMGTDPTPRKLHADMSHLQEVPLEQATESIASQQDGSVLSQEAARAGTSPHLSHLQAVPVRSTAESALLLADSVAAGAASMSHDAAHTHLQVVQTNKLRSTTSLPSQQTALARGHSTMAASQPAAAHRGNGLPPVLAAAFSAAAVDANMAGDTSVSAVPRMPAAGHGLASARSTQSNGEISEMQWEPSATTFSSAGSLPGCTADVPGPSAAEDAQPLRESLRARYSVPASPEPNAGAASEPPPAHAQSAPLPQRLQSRSDAVLNSTSTFPAFQTVSGDSSMQHTAPDDQYSKLLDDWSASYQSGERASPDAGIAEGVQAVAATPLRAVRADTTVANAAQQHIVQQFAIKKAGHAPQEGAASVLVQAGSFNEPLSPQAGAPGRNAQLGQDGSAPLATSAATSATHAPQQRAHIKRLLPTQPSAMPNVPSAAAAEVSSSAAAHRQPSSSSVQGVQLSTADIERHGNPDELLTPTAHEKHSSTVRAPAEASTADLREIVRELSHDATADLSPLAKSAAHHPEVNDSGGMAGAGQTSGKLEKTLLQRVAAKLGAGGSAKLAPHLAAQIQRVLSVGRQPFDNSNPVHLKALQLLYARYVHAPCPARTGLHWEQQLGFQGADPATDLRGSGMLALAQMLQLHAYNRDNAAVIYQASQHADKVRTC